MGWLKERYLSLATLFLLVFIPLYPKFPLFSVPGTYVKVRADDLVVGAAFLIWFLTEARCGWKVFRQRLPQLVLVYWFISLVSVFNAIFITRTVSPAICLLHFLRRVEYMSLFFIGFRAWSQVKSWRPYLVGLATVVLGVFTFGIGQKYYGWPVISTMNEEFSKGLILKLDVWTRISSTFAGHYDLAVFAVLTICFLVGAVLGLRRASWRRGGMILVILSFYLLILTASRVSFGAYLVAVVFVLLVARRYWLIGPVLVVSLLAINLNSDLTQRYLATFKLEPTVFSRWRFWEKSGSPPPSAPTPVPTKSALEGGEPSGVTIEPQERVVLNPVPIYPEPEPAVIAAQRSNDIRFKVEWPRALRAFFKNPLWGTGFSSVTLATDNDYLRALAETGLMGLVSFGLIFFEYGRQFVLFLSRSRPGLSRTVIIGITGGVVGMLANAFFIDVFEASKVAYIFWLWVGLAGPELAVTLRDQERGGK